jgi:ligand-binding SRPBCC domain-containing protein
MPKSYTLTFTSELNATAEAVWAVVGTWRGVNEELAPWLQMTAPQEASKSRIEDAPVGRVIFVSWVLVGGVFPIDRHSLKMAKIDPGEGFLEDSTSWSQKNWEHQRQVKADGERSCIVTDRLTFTPRVSALGPMIERVIAAVFRHRHRRLKARFGAAATR